MKCMARELGVTYPGARTLALRIQKLESTFFECWRFDGLEPTYLLCKITY